MLVTISCVAVAVTVLFCRKKEGFRMDVTDSGCRATGRAAWNFPSVSTVIGSCMTARSRRFNTRRVTRVVESLRQSRKLESVLSCKASADETNTFANVVVDVFSKGCVWEKKMRPEHKSKKIH
jgi:hypothetical protein